MDIRRLRNRLSQDYHNIVIQLLKEQLKYSKLAALPQIHSIFEQNLRSDEEKKVYELSDGERSIRDIEKITNVGRTKISNLWKKWYLLGIMEKSEKYEGKRIMKSFSLLDFGISIDLPGSQVQMNTEEFE